MILLDTDILTLLFRGHSLVQGRVASAETDVATTVITWMEIMRGRFEAVFKAGDAVELERAYQRFGESVRQLATLAIVPITAAAAHRFATLLRNKKLKKIGRGDLLIASIALAEGAILVTRNLRDFTQVPGLRSENWAG